MNKILVSGTSGIIGYGILRSIRKAKPNCKLVGTTIYEDSVAQEFCDIFEKAPLTSDLHYIDWLKATILKHQIDIIIPGIEADMYKWVENINEIKQTGVKVVINNEELMSFCKDKWFFFEQLKLENPDFAIESSLENNFDELVESFGLPFLLKPRNGHGSKGIVKVTSREVFLEFVQDIGAVLMAQPIVGSDDEEYSTSAFCDGKGGYFASLTLKRKLSKDGFTEKAEVINLPQIDLMLNALCKQFNPVGPTNFQTRMHKGKLKLLEINPRISSATSIRTAFGYNESAMAIEYYWNGINPTQPKIKQGKAIRYIEDLIIYK